MRVAEAVHNMVDVLTASNRWFWALETDRLLALLNDDIPRTLATFSGNTALGIPANAMLDELSLPQFPSRAPTEMGRTDITFTGTFVVVPAPIEI